MKLLALLIPLALLGCRILVVEDPNTHVRLIAGSCLTSPKIGSARVVIVTPTTKAMLTLSDFDSQSNVTGADLANLGTAIAKMFLPVP